MESKWRPNSAAGVPVATTAFMIRAPSQWVLRPCSCASSATDRTWSNDQQLPPPKFEVCSTDTSRDTGAWRIAGRSAAATCSALKMPRSPCSGRSRARLMTAGPAASEVRGWAVSSRMISSPALQCTANAISLHIVPEGRNTAASCPSRAATMSCSRLVVGSSNFCSSPTSASAIAWRIAGEGLVTVSLKRSTRISVTGRGPAP